MYQKIEEWACHEVTDFGTRDNPFCWHKETEWNKILEEIDKFKLEEKR